MTSSPTAGGFIPQAPLSPAPSTATSSVASSTLPHPRSHPLRSGSVKETAFINHVDNGVQQVTRRYAMKNTGEAAAGGTKGYESFREVAKDIQRLVDVVWVSGTPNLQVAYLISLAVLVVTYLPSFPPAPRATFNLLRKLDAAFASLIQGRDVDTDAQLPGFDARTRVSNTERVRIKSVVERTRVVVVTVMGRGEYEDEDEDEDELSDGEHMEVADFNPEEENSLQMDVARVYDRTLVELGDSLDGPMIGIARDD